MNYYLLSDGAGNIVQSGYCLEVDIPQPSAGQQLIVGFPAHATSHFVKNGELVAYTPEQAAARAARPNYTAHWDNDAMAWIDDRDLDQLRAAKWNEVKSARDAAEYGGFVWDGSSFDSNEVSQGRIQGAALAAMLASANGQPFSTDWTLADNAVRTLDGPSMIQVGMALMVHITTQHEKGRLLRAQVEDPAATADQIASVTW